MNSKYMRLNTVKSWLLGKSCNKNWFIEMACHASISQLSSKTTACMDTLKQLKTSSYVAGQFCSIDSYSWQYASWWPSIFITKQGFIIMVVLLALQKSFWTGETHESVKTSCFGERLVIGHNRERTDLKSRNWKLGLGTGLQLIAFELLLISE